MNPTLEKFGYPATLLVELEHWAILLRREQVTLGSLVLAATVWTAGGIASPTALFIAQNAINFVLINIFLAIFNLIPLPPFDGGHVVQGLLPPRAAASFGKIGRFSLLVLIFLLLVLPMISPNADVVRRIVSPIANGLAGLLFGIAGVGIG